MVCRPKVESTQLSRECTTTSWQVRNYRSNTRGRTVTFHGCSSQRCRQPRSLVVVTAAVVCFAALCLIYGMKTIPLLVFLPSAKTAKTEQHFMTNTINYADGAAGVSTKETEFQTVYNHTLHNDTKPVIVIYLDGELGNHLGHILQGFGIKWYAREAFGVDLDVHFTYPPSSKYDRVRETVTKCFPKIKHIWGSSHLHDSKWKEYPERLQERKQWLPAASMEVIANKSQRFDTPQNLDPWLSTFVKEYTRSDKPPRPPESVISLPFLEAYGLGSNWLFDHYFDQLRDMFEFNHASKYCCGVLPDDDETVFHYRNFHSEAPNSFYTEFGPTQLARDVFGHLNPGEKVAIVSRFLNKRTMDRVSALSSRGLNVRVIGNQTGVQDFCFLMNAKKEIIGNSLSTFTRWASLLSSSQSIRWTTAVAPSLLKFLGVDFDTALHRRYNFTHPWLEERIKMVKLAVTNE